MSTTVVNWRRGEKYNVRITRGTLFGNPFEIGPDGDRATVLHKHRIYLASLIADPSGGTAAEMLHIQYDALRGLRLGCVCKPHECHGDTLALLADMSRDERKAWAAGVLTEKEQGE